MIVYEHPLSPYAQKVKISLREKSIPFETRMPDALGSGTSDAFERLNPRVEVPVLVDGDTTIFDSTIILEYIEDKYPIPAMLPKSPASRARARMIEDVCDTHFEAINWGLGEVRFFKRGGAELGPKLRARGLEQISDLHDWLSGHLGDRDWLVGDAFGWADLSAIPYVTMSEMFGAPPHRGSALERWKDRVCARPAVKPTIAEAMAAIPAMENIGALFAEQGFKREFRDHRLEWLVRSGGVEILVDALSKDEIRFTETKSFLGHRPSSAA